MTNVYFVRHAAPNYKNHNDLERELSEKGLQDRALVTAFLADKEICAVFSSPYKRSMDTVRPFSEAKALPIIPVEAFRERKIDSCWIEDFDSFSKNQWEDFRYKLTDGESLGEVQKRNIAALNRVLEKYEGKNIVIGSHGTALSTVINYYDPGFGYADFNRIRGLMPWIVKFCFEGQNCICIESYDLFEKRVEPLFPR